MQFVLQAYLAEPGPRRRIQLGHVSAVFDVYFVDVFHQRQRGFLAYMLVQIAAEIVGDIVFAVRKSSRSAEARHNGTGFAFYTRLYFFAVDGAFSLFERVPALEHRHFFAAVSQLECRKNTAGSGSDDYYVIIHVFLLLRGPAGRT